MEVNYNSKFIIRSQAENSNKQLDYNLMKMKLCGVQENENAQSLVKVYGKKIIRKKK